MYIEKLSTSPIWTVQHISQLKNPDFLRHLTLGVSRIINIDNIDTEELGRLNFILGSTCTDYI